MIKQKFVNKILKNSGSFNYYKDNYEKLSENLNESNKKINDLENDLKIKDEEIDKLRFILNNIEEGFIFSIVMALYNTEKYLSEAIESVINQTFPFSKVQLILVDDGSSDDSKNICLNYVEKYPDNIKYIYQENQGQSAARNKGLRFIEGKFVNFLDSDDKLELNCLEEIYYHFLKFGEEIDIISIPRYTFDSFSKTMPFFEKYNPPRIVDIKEEYDFPITPINSAFIRKCALVNREFDKRVIISEDSLLINKIILNKCKFGVVNSTKYLYRKRLEENSTIDTKKLDKSYYNPRMEFYFKELIRYSMENYGCVLKYIQSVLMYDLKWFFLQNTEVGVLDNEELEEFHNQIYEVLQVIDDDIILSQDFSKFLKYHMLNIKYDAQSIELKEGIELMLLVNNNEFDKLGNNKLNISDISIDKNVCTIKCNFFYYFNDFEIKLRNNDEIVNNVSKFISEKITIGQPFEYEFEYEFRFNLNKHINELIFEFVFNSKIYSLNLVSRIKNEMSDNISINDKKVIIIN